MNITELKDEFGGLVAELKTHVDSTTGSLEIKNKEAFERINERIDQVESFAAAIKSTPKVEDEDIEHVVAFKKALTSFGQGKNREEIATGIEVKNGYFGKGIEAKSENLVRFDFASAGALTLPAAISEQIIKNVIEYTPVMGLARMTRTDREVYKRRVRTSTPGGRWLAEEAENTKG